MGFQWVNGMTGLGPKMAAAEKSSPDGEKGAPGKAVPFVSYRESAPDISLLSRCRWWKLLKSHLWSLEVDWSWSQAVEIIGRFMRGCLARRRLRGGQDDCCTMHRSIRCVPMNQRLVSLMSIKVAMWGFTTWQSSTSAGLQCGDDSPRICEREHMKHARLAPRKLHGSLGWPTLTNNLVKHVFAHRSQMQQALLSKR